MPPRGPLNDGKLFLRAAQGVRAQQRKQYLEEKEESATEPETALEPRKGGQSGNPEAQGPSGKWLSRPT